MPTATAETTGTERVRWTRYNVAPFLTKRERQLWDEMIGDESLRHLGASMLARTTADADAWNDTAGDPVPDKQGVVRRRPGASLSATDLAFLGPRSSEPAPLSETQELFLQETLEGLRNL